MSVRFINFDKESGGQRSGPDGIDENVTHQYTVKADRNDGLHDVLADPQLQLIAAYGALVSFQGRQLYVVGVNGDEIEPRLWKIEIEYATRAPQKRDPNPLNRPAEIVLDGNETQIPVYRDGEGTWYVNTAGDFLEGVTEEYEQPIWRVSKNVVKTPAWILKYPGAVNSDTVRMDGLTFKPGELRLKRLRRGGVQEENNQSYFALSFELHYREGGWIRQIPNRGHYEIVTTNATNAAAVGAAIGGIAGGIIAAANVAGQTDTGTERRRILIGSPAAPTEEPVFLDQNGAAYRDDDGNVRTRLDPDEIVVLEFRRGQRLPFSVLPLK